jgi:hypothetical protein
VPWGNFPVAAFNVPTTQQERTLFFGYEKTGFSRIIRSGGLNERKIPNALIIYDL